MSEPPSEEKTGRNWRRIGLIGGGVILVISIAFWLWLPAYGLNTAKRFLRWKFDDIHHITTAELVGQMKGENPPAILDIRGLEEYETSHLPNARHLLPESSDAQIQKLLSGIRTSQRPTIRAPVRADSIFIIGLIFNSIYLLFYYFFISHIFS